MTCVCTGISVKVTDNGWYSADVHVTSKDDGVYIFRITNESNDESPFYPRQATIECGHPISWFDQSRTFSTLVVSRDVVKLNELAADYMKSNMPHA